MKKMEKKYYCGKCGDQIFQGMNEKIVERIYDEILAEKQRQDKEHGEQEHRKQILLEELLETDPEKQRVELIQIAAGAVALIECLDRRVE